eukprot:PhF_6_TR12237/c0_g1_i3/m.19376
MWRQQNALAVPTPNLSTTFTSSSQVTSSWRAQSCQNTTSPHTVLAPYHLNTNISLSDSLDNITSIRDENRRLHKEAVQRNLDILNLRDETRRLRGTIADLELQRDEKQGETDNLIREVERLKQENKGLQSQISILKHKGQSRSGSTPTYGEVHVGTLAEVLSNTRYLANIVECQCRGMPLDPNMKYGNPEDLHVALHNISTRTPDEVLTETAGLLRGMETLLVGHLGRSQMDPNGDGCAMQ